MSEERELKTSEAQRKAQLKWNKDNLERLSISFKRGHRERWQAAAEKSGMTLTMWALCTLDNAADEIIGGNTNKK